MIDRTMFLSTLQNIVHKWSISWAIAPHLIPS